MGGVLEVRSEYSANRCLLGFDVGLILRVLGVAVCGF